MIKDRRALLLLFLLFIPLAAYAQEARTTARVETVQFKSASVGAALPYNVVLPPDYDALAAAQTRYPVLYLLHGLAGHYSDWISHSRLADYAAQYHMIIITPEGNDSWYTDSATVATDKYETYILRELIPDVGRRFRTIEAREGRAIAGLSMGGYGALKFGLKYPEMFSFAASLSGALKAASWTENELKSFPWPLVPLTIKRAFGPDGSPTHEANDIFKLLRALPAERIPSLPYFYLDCGTEDELVTSSREFSGILMERKIPHEYRQLPGKHEWPYWNQQVRTVLQLAEQKMSKKK